MKSFFSSVSGKIVFIAFLVIIMLIPIGMIRGIIDERQERYEEAVTEVSQKWGTAQEITGPILTIPYTHTWEEVVKVEGQDDKRITKSQTRYLNVLPESLNYDGTLDPELKARGIYEVVLYRLSLNTSGHFVLPDISELGIDQNTVKWDQAFLTMGLPDTRGIQEAIPLAWNGQSLSFKPGLENMNFLSSATSQLFADSDGNQANSWRSYDDYGYEDESASGFAGLQAKVPGVAPGNNKLSFDFTLDVKGSQQLSFWPTGKETTATLRSDWNTPSFDGYFLPETSDNDDNFDNGFVADWKMSYFGRKYGQHWQSPGNDQTMLNNIQASRFGVKLILPIDFYQKNDRAIKYAILFIGLTFLTFFGFELLRRTIRVHPLQYLLIGLAMCVFYLLLLSFSEQLGFSIAYWVSSLATIGLITAYSLFLLQAQRHAWVVGLVLVWVYLLLFILLQLKDYALMVGSIAIFLILATIMWITRKIDWYAVNLDAGSKKK